MLGLEDTKGTLKPGADADFVVLKERQDPDGSVRLVVDDVWKFGVQVHHNVVRNAISSLSILNSTHTLRLLKTSDVLLHSFQAHLQSSSETMLPSYTHTLPSGSETGTAVAVDLGGSTLRVGVIQLLVHPNSRYSDKDVHSKKKVLVRRSVKVGADIKRSRSKVFFDWIVDQIALALKMAGQGDGHGMVMGITWSFPVE